MSEEKQPTQVTPSIPSEQAGKVESTAKPQEVPVEDLKKELEGTKAHIKTLQGNLKVAQQRGIPKEELDSLRKEIASMKKFTAKALDDVVSRISGEYEESKPSRKTYSQQIEEEETVQKPEPSPKQIDPDVQKFINYIHSQELEYDNPLVQEAVADERTPQEALKYLKDKAKGQTQAEVDKLADEKAKTMLEQKLKDLGYTVSGASGPSAPASTWREKTPEEKLLLGVSGKK